MSILTATNLSQSHGFTDVFTGISVSITHDAKIGLIGPNGVGKTTLLRVLAGLDKPTAGSVSLAKGKRVGYLPQEAMDAFAGDTNSVYSEMLSAFEHLHAIEARMRELEHEMANVGAGLAPAHRQGGQPRDGQPRDGQPRDGQPRDGQPQGLPLQQMLLEEYGELQDQFTHLGGYEYETRIKQTLDGLGFHRANWDMPVAHLSGGQKTRALLAKLLLEQPDLLMLDEPTNHLDVEAIEWLEKTLIVWRGALLIVSHDRYFLNRVVNRIWEMSRTKVEVYRGNYTAYTQQREERFQRSLFVFNQVKADFENELRIIKRDLDAVKAGNSDKSVTWAKGRLRLLSRNVQTVEAIGAEGLIDGKWQEMAADLGPMPAVYTYEEAERHVRALRPPSRPARVKLSLGVTKRSGDIVLRTKNLVVGYPGNALFEAGDIILRWKDRAALIGPNGAGKTTFIKTALNPTPPPLKGSSVSGWPTPLRGEVELGPSVVAGYFAQAHDELDQNARIIEEIQKHKRLSDGEARHYLAQFLFSNDDVFKPVSGLSGGERARLALAILQLKGANLLVLDEPTNHLDITAQEELQAALEGYNGTILLVSHDRYLIDKLATHIWHIEDGRLQVFNGTYAEWTKWRSTNPPSPQRGGDGGGAVGKETKNEIPRNARNGKSAKPNKNADKKRQQQIADAEARITALEAKLKELAEAMQKNKGTAEVTSLSIEYALAQRELDKAMKQWETIAT
jgi:ATP-binding cassette subfamily F protein 3